MPCIQQAKCTNTWHCLACNLQSFLLSFQAGKKALALPEKKAFHSVALLGTTLTHQPIRMLLLSLLLLLKPCLSHTQHNTTGKQQRKQDGIMVA